MSTAEDMREKPGFIGKGVPVPLVCATDEKPEGTGLALTEPLTWGAGKVMNPVESRTCGAAALAASFFLLFVFSVFPFDSGWGSRNSDA